MLGALGGSPAAAQPSGKTYRIAVLAPPLPVPAQQARLAALRQTLGGLGFASRSLEITYLKHDGDATHLATLIAQVLRENPDVIVAVDSLATAAAKRATTTVPIVMIRDSDPIGSGFIASLARPGGNITGTTDMSEDLNGKRLQLLKEVLPHLRRIAVLRNPRNPATLVGWRQTGEAARTIGVTALPVDISSAGQIRPAFTRIAGLHADALMVLGDPVTAGDAAGVVRGAAAQRLPAIYEQTLFTGAGGFLVYGPADIALWDQAATYVGRILKGAKPADLPVERPTTFELTVNLKVARALGITVPRSILLQATQVIR